MTPKFSLNKDFSQDLDNFSQKQKAATMIRAAADVSEAIHPF